MNLLHIFICLSISIFKRSADFFFIAVSGSGISSSFCYISTVYDVLTGQQVCKLDGHSSCVRDVDWHPYKNVIMSTSVIFAI